MVYGESCCLIGSGLCILACVFLPLGYKAQANFLAIQRLEYSSLECQLLGIQYATKTGFASVAPKERCEETWTYSFGALNNTHTTNHEDSRFVCDKKDCGKCAQEDFWGPNNFQGAPMSPGDTTACWGIVNCSLSWDDCYFFEDPSGTIEKESSRAQGLLIAGWTVLAVGALAFCLSGMMILFCSR